MTESGTCAGSMPIATMPMAPAYGGYGMGNMMGNMWGMDGMWGGGMWWWFIILFLFWGNNGWNNNNNTGWDAAAVIANSSFQGNSTRNDITEGFRYNTLEQGIRGNANGICDLGYAMQSLSNNNNITTLQGFGDVSRQLCQGFNGAERTIDNLGYNMGQGFNGTQREIMQNRFENQQCCCRTQQEIQQVRAENYRNTCEITNAIHSEGEQTRALINANTMQDLRDRLEARDRDVLIRDFQISQQAQTSNLVSELRPCSKPCYVTCSPYQSALLPFNAGFGYGWNGYNGYNNGNGCNGCCG